MARAEAGGTVSASVRPSTARAHAQDWLSRLLTWWESRKHLQLSAQCVGVTPRWFETERSLRARIHEGIYGPVEQFKVQRGRVAGSAGVSRLPGVSCAAGACRCVRLVAPVLLAMSDAGTEDALVLAVRLERLARQLRSSVGHLTDNRDPEESRIEVESIVAKYRAKP